MMKKILISFAVLVATSDISATAGESVTLSLKTPGNPVREYRLDASGKALDDNSGLPVAVVRETVRTEEGMDIRMVVTANEPIYVSLSQLLPTGFSGEKCQYLMPGFWYRRNLRSPERAPSFRVSESWTVREDRLSVPLTAVYDESSREWVGVVRTDEQRTDAPATHHAGDIMLPEQTTLGFTGFSNEGDATALHCGYPWMETPHSYIRKLTLNPPARAFARMEPGESISLNWRVIKGQAKDYSDFVEQVWTKSYAIFDPKPLERAFSAEVVKETLANYFTGSYVDRYPLKYTSGVWLRVADCSKNHHAEVGFVGRVLLNAFNAYEYGMENNRPELAGQGKDIFDSWLKNGFTDGGVLREVVDFRKNETTAELSIRRQSEGLYAVLLYLDYERRNNRSHPEWERRVKGILDAFSRLQHEDGSFPRKFDDALSPIDPTGGSTPSATLPLVMAYKYFKNKDYLKMAKLSAKFLDDSIISKADYYSSTLDANCEDKEASLYASTAMWYLAMVSKGRERAAYAESCRKAAFFSLSWYYLWDVPFARGQMLGDIGLKSRGWGNVSVENNHIDVFVFEFGSVLDWLAEEYNDRRFSDFSDVIRTSMTQLLPYEGHMCGVAKTGYYPEVVQHTTWDYGRNGKGFYNDMFAPGWVVASLWELLTPGRAEKFLNEK